MKRAIGYCLAYLASVFLLSGCNLVVFNPKGQIATDERDLIILATGLMLLVVVPVIAMPLSRSSSASPSVTRLMPIFASV